MESATFDESVSDKTVISEAFGRYRLPFSSVYPPDVVFITLMYEPVLSTPMYTFPSFVDDEGSDMSWPLSPE